MKPRISIVIPCYNSYEYIRETLDCLLKQTIEDWECVIVNDGSTDDSLTIIREFENKDSRFKVIDKPNEGPAIARNVAIRNSSGEFILPLDSDDLIAPTYAEKAINYFYEHPETKLVYCLCELFGDMKGEFLTPEYKYDNILWNNCIVCSAVYRRSDFDKTTGYNPNMKCLYEDWDFWLSLLNPDDIVYRIPERLFFYRMHGVSRNNKDISYFREAERTIVLNHIEKYRPYMENIIVTYNEAQAFKAVVNSASFRLGLKLLEPLKKIRKIIKR